jgi:hypothetical protein
MFMFLEVDKRRRSSSSSSHSSHHSSPSSSSGSVELEIAEPGKEHYILTVNHEGAHFKLGKHMQSYFGEKHKDKLCVVRLDNKDNKEKIDLKDELKGRVHVWDSECKHRLWPKEDGSKSGSSSKSKHSSSSSKSHHSSSSKSQHSL